MDDERLQIHKTSVSGLITCRTSLEPISVVHSLRKFATENPYQFRFAIRFTPLQRCVPSEIDHIVAAAGDLIDTIHENETYRVTVRKRHTTLGSMDIIGAVADIVSRKVDLDNPEKVVWIEVVDEWSGISVLEPEKDILSIRSMQDE